MVKNPPLPAIQEMQETGVRFLDGEETLEEEMTTHSSILAWKIPWTEEPGGLQTMGSQRDTSGHTHTLICIHCSFADLYFLMFLKGTLSDFIVKAMGKRNIYFLYREPQARIRKIQDKSDDTFPPLRQR